MTQFHVLLVVMFISRALWECATAFAADPRAVMDYRADIASRRAGEAIQRVLSALFAIVWGIAAWEVWP